MTFVYTSSLWQLHCSWGEGYHNSTDLLNYDMTSVSLQQSSSKAFTSSVSLYMYLPNSDTEDTVQKLRWDYFRFRTLHPVIFSWVLIIGLIKKQYRNESICWVAISQSWNKYENIIIHLYSFLLSSIQKHTTKSSFQVDVQFAWYKDKCL